MDTIDTSMSPTIYVVSQTDDGPHRRPIVPGRFTAADTWEATDISAESDEVQSACTSAWTDEAVAAFKTLNPFVAVTPPPAAQDATSKLISFLAANPDVKALLGL